LTPPNFYAVTGRMCNSASRHGAGRVGHTRLPAGWPARVGLADLAHPDRLQRDQTSTARPSRRSVRRSPPSENPATAMRLWSIRPARPGTTAPR